MRQTDIWASGMGAASLQVSAPLLYFRTKLKDSIGIITDQDEQGIIVNTLKERAAGIPTASMK